MPLFRRRRRIVCQKAVELMTDYLEDALAPADRTRLEAHLEDCPHCREYLAQLRTTIAAARDLDPGELAPEVRDELVSLYRRWRAG